MPSGRQFLGWHDFPALSKMLDVWDSENNVKDKSFPQIRSRWGWIETRLYSGSVLACTQLIPIGSLAPHSVPQALPGAIPDCRGWSKS